MLEARDARLHALLAGLSPEAQAAPATIGGGDWSAKDLVAHIALWEELALTTLGLWRAGELPPRREVDEINAEGQANSQGLALDAVLAKYDDAHARLVAAIQSLSDDEWNERRTGNDREVLAR